MRIVKCDCSQGLNDECIEAAKTAAEDIAAGRLVVYPTDTVYGIGADIYNQTAVKNLYLAKNRPFDMALSVAVADKKMMEQVAVLNDNADKLIKAFLPGPLTIIIKKQPDVPDLVTSSSQKVGVRIPDHPLAVEIARRAGPIIATSANTHSQPDAVNIDMAVKELGDAVSTYVDAGPSPLGQPSTIVWLMDNKYEIIRQGAITEVMIKEALQC
ncbi:MAG: L-threonylcarbamoyladenylate synthase [Candidatus Methanomethylophilus sp.]|nr:L-threonylcarbamoyladenylate synthase [Methanomethylophilus sp.]MDD3232559.1 L-threonylcarbamoyladenylate synthase [Methanomethylophilus sp.]MDD4668294.1 L-threonylcarbamoyladenylate synthase [Methanomethylophilus sp.]